MGANLYSTFDITLQSSNTILFLKTVFKCCLKQFLNQRVTTRVQVALYM